MSKKISLKGLPGTSSVFLKGNKTGFLFLHGFTGTPYEGLELTRHIHEEIGCTASIPLLPGHGTVPHDLKNIRWQDWNNCVREEYLLLKNSCSRVFVCGQSMGGALALHLASHHSVAGIITLAGAVFLKDWRLYLLPVARHILTFQHKSKGPDICNKKLKSEVPTYSKYPVKSVDELLALMKHTRQDLIEVTAPVLLFHSRKDRTVHFGNLNYIYDHIASKQKKKIVLNDSYHVISIDIEKNIVFNEIKSFIKEILGNQKKGS